MKSITLPSLLPFLVSTLRPFRSKLRARILLILMTSSSATSSSMLSIIMPRLEYSRTDLASRMVAVDFLRSGPSRRKAIILSESGSIIG